MAKYTNYDYIYNMAYVYRHIRLDKNEVFYVGIANHKRKDYVRANEKSRRNDWWKKIAEKTNYRIDIVFDDVTIEFAKQKEIEFIQLYGRKDLGLGTLVNMTDGGDGLNNRVFTSEYKKKLSDAAKKRVLSETHKQKLREYRLGKKITQEHKDKISLTMKNYVASDSLRKFRSQRMTQNNPSKDKFGINAINFKGYVKAYKNKLLYGIYEGVYAASRELNINPSNINRVIKGDRKTSGGFVFTRE
jgi:hypothetical protein